MTEQQITIDIPILSYEEVEKTPKPQIVGNLLNKSREAFLLSIEIYNKPTIKYRVEGFSFFICNAWELLLKAYLICKGGEESIYYPDKPDRSFSLERCVKEVFTNEKDPLRINLENIIELRNTFTHFITQEYEVIYTPLFQATVINYAEKHKQFFEESISTFIDTSFLTLVISKPQLEDHEMLEKYGASIFRAFDSRRAAVRNLISEHHNDKLAIGIDIAVKITKKTEDPDVTIRIDSSSTNEGIILDKVKDTNSYYPYNQKRAIDQIHSKLNESGSEAKITSFGFNVIATEYNIYANPKYCYFVKIGGENARKVYSHLLVEFIASLIFKDKDIVAHIRAK